MEKENKGELTIQSAVRKVSNLEWPARAITWLCHTKVI